MSLPPPPAADAKSLSGRAGVDLSSELRATLTSARLWLWGVGAARAAGQLMAVTGVLLVPTLLLVASQPVGVAGRRILVGLVVGLGLGLLIRELAAVARLARSDRLSQLVECAAPWLHDRVTTSVELSATLPPGASRSLARAHIERTGRALRHRPPGPALSRHLWMRARFSLLAGLLGAGVLGAALLLVPGRVALGAASLLSSSAASTVPGQLLPLVTDISLTYRYPAYLGRVPRVVEGTTGDIVAPRGTEVAIRGFADRPVTGAALLVGEIRQPLEVTAPRGLQGALLVSEAGRYRFLLATESGELTEHDGHAIHVERDAPPEVQLIEPLEDLVVREGDVVEIVYRAGDDVGLSAAALVVELVGGGGEPARRPLEVAPDSPRQQRGSARLDLAAVNAKPGDRVAVHVEALDNDTISGPKRGRSEVRILKVFSAAEHHEALLERLAAVFKQLVLVLADELEHPFAAEPDDLSVARRQLEQARTTLARSRDVVDSLTDLVAAFEGDSLAPAEVARALRYARGELRRLLDERGALFGALDSYFEVAERYQLGYAQRLSSGQGPFVTSLERHVLYLEDLLQRERMSAARMMAEELSDAQERLAELLEAYRANGDEGTRREILAELDRLRRRTAELLQRMARLQRTVSDEYVNPEAFAQRDLPDLLERLQRRIGEGQIEEAFAELDRLRAATRSLRDDMTQAEASFGGEAYAGLRRRLQELRRELDNVEESQRSLAEGIERRFREEVERVRRQRGESTRRLTARLRRVARRALEQLNRIDPASLESYELSYRGEARERVDETERALGVDNLEAARESALRSLPPLTGLESSLGSRARFPENGVPSGEGNRRRVAEAAARVGEIVSELDRMFPTPDRLRDPAALRALRNGARTQRGLRGRLERAQRGLDAISEEVPIFDESHRELLREAEGEMREAARDLDAREMAGASGHQREALAKLTEFQRAMEAMGSGQGGAGAGMPFPWGRVDRDAEGWGPGQSRERVEIPGAEAHQAPAAFRRDILEAMKEPAPEAFRDRVRRYYEELVR